MYYMLAKTPGFRHFLLLLSFLYGGQLLAQSTAIDTLLTKADILKTKNGNFVIGQLKTAERGKLAFKIVDIEEEEIKLKDIAEIRAKTADFQVDIRGHKRFVGRIESGGKPGSFMAYNARDTIIAPITDIIQLKRVELSFLERFDGYINLGFTYSDASKISRFTLNNATIYGTEKYKFFQTGSVILTLGDNVSGVDRVDLGLGGFYGLNDRWLVLQYFQYQKIQSMGLKSRISSISGAGLRLAHTRTLDFNAISGITLQKEWAISGVEAKLQAEIPLLFDFKLGIITPKLELSGMAIIFGSLSVPNRIRLDDRISLTYEAIKDFTIGLQGLYNYDTDPISIGQSKQDLNISVTLGLKF